jgi:hypothetical protein
MLTLLYSCVCSDLVVQVKCSPLCVSAASLSAVSLRHEHHGPDPTPQFTRKVRVRKAHRHGEQGAFGGDHVVLQPANAREVTNRYSYLYRLTAVEVISERRISRSVVYEGSVVSSLAHFRVQMFRLGRACRLDW